jgi:acyl carrier protein
VISAPSRSFSGNSILTTFEITAATTADNVPGWDSLSHVRILLAVEVEYGVRFSAAEVLRMTRVGDLQALVDRKLA